MTIGARYDTMDPLYMESMARTLTAWRDILDCAAGSPHGHVRRASSVFPTGLIRFSRISWRAGSRFALPSASHQLASLPTRARYRSIPAMGSSYGACSRPGDLLVYGLIFMVPIAPFGSTASSGTRKRLVPLAF